MLFNSEVDQIEAHALLKRIEHERASRIAYYQKRYDIHKGLITDPLDKLYNETLCLEIFPKGRTETLDEYRERMKLWVPLGRLILNRIVDLSFKGQVTYGFEEEGLNAQEATDSVNADFEYNRFETKVRDLVCTYLGIGEMSTWLSYRAYDPETGRQFDNGGRIKFVDRYPWFAEMIVHPDNVTEQVGSIAVYDYENFVITPSVNAAMRLDGKSKRKIEMWLAPRYDTRNGQIIDTGGYWEFENEKVTNSGELESFTESNLYGIDPTVFWISPDTDETQYRGVSYHDRYLDSWLKLSRVASSEISQIQYLVSIWKLLFADKTPPVIELRPNAVNAIPLAQDAQPDLSQTERMLDLNEEREFKKFLVNVIGEAGGYSGDLMSGLEGVGKISESGIARKIVYEKTLNTVRAIRANFTAPASRLMLNSVKIKVAEGGLKIKTDDLKPRIVFDDDIMPLDESQVLLDDILKYDKKIITLEELVFKHNDRFKNMQEVRDYIESEVKPQIEAERQAQMQERKRFLGNGFNRGN